MVDVFGLSLEDIKFIRGLKSDLDTIKLRLNNLYNLENIQIIKYLGTNSGHTPAFKQATLYIYNFNTRAFVSSGTYMLSHLL